MSMLTPPDCPSSCRFCGCVSDCDWFKENVMQPTYYVKHPDGSFSEAEPQPIGDILAALKPAEENAARLERERIIDLLTSECFPYALCLPTSEDGDWEPVMEVAEALDPNTKTIVVNLD